MARPRIQLHAILSDILASVDEKYATGHCYYRKPPKNMNYPCIVYNIDTEWNLNGDNKKYIHYNRYIVTVIDEDPDSVIKNLIGDLEFSFFDREYETDNLNHFSYSLYF